MNNRITIDSYIMYGLNKHRAFLAPPTCEDCGHDGDLVFEDSDDLKEFCGFVLMDHDCENCAIFVVHRDGIYEAFMKMDEDEGAIGIIRSDDMHMFAELDGELRFCCYSLLMETDEGIYEIKK